MLRVASLHEYPVKSCRGSDVDALVLDAKGPVRDRRFMLVDAAGRFVTQREHHALAQVVPHLSEQELTLDAPGRATLHVPLEGELESRPVTVWRYAAPALDLGREASEWLTALLGEPVHLVRFDERQERHANPEHAPPSSSAGRFSDGYPILLASLSSLGDLNRRLAAPLPMNRFRPNLVVDGNPPWEEDGWKELAIGDLHLLMAKPCERCVVTTVDQATGEVGKEPLRTLATFRKRDGGVYFGVNLVHLGPGVVRVGDPIRVIA